MPVSTGNMSETQESGLGSDQDVGGIGSHGVG